MQKLSGQCNGEFILLHGGAGATDPKGELVAIATDRLQKIAAQAWDHKYSDQEHVSLVVHGLKEMELDPLFNAGRGAVLQEDGIARLTAALMEGSQQRFSGVINITDVLHPSLVALALQKQDARVLGFPGNELCARSLKLPLSDNVTPKRLKQWYDVKQKSCADKSYDTVGCIAKVGLGLAAGTSTGGRENVSAGRVSDSATVAGTYGSPHVAVSLTGVGEQIVDDGVAVRIETRVRDGMSLKDACEKTFSEALHLKREYGWIALTARGEWAVYYTTDAMPFVVWQKGSGIVASSK